MSYNSGDSNSGGYNSGSYNSGDSNSGDSNSGNYNSGSCNSGVCNSGDFNSGNYNSGNYNSGDFNSGFYNSGDFNSGFFNSKENKYIFVFNKKCSMKKWRRSVIPNFLLKDFDLRSYKENFAAAYKSATEEDKKLLFLLPNFDHAVFKKITGIDTKKEFKRFKKSQKEEKK